MIDIFQGDPALLLTNDGAEITFKGGQPLMDQGLENQAQISLFTAKGWGGNFLLSEDQRIGSDFEEKARGPITLTSLAELEKTAEKAMESPTFGTVRAVVTNPESWRINMVITITPPGRSEETILLTTNGQNWINQALNPAHERF